MWIAVIFGYFLSAAFAYCGMMNLAVYISEVEDSTSYLLFVKGLPEAGWPLAVGMILYVLIQIALLLEKRALSPSDARLSSSSTKKEDSPTEKKRRTNERETSQEVYFRIQPPPPLPESPVSSTPPPASTPCASASAPASKMEREQFPPPPHGETESGEKRKKLSFFRVD